eukprot:6214500-Pleurochrysis_carterae.AAC.3
MLKPKGRGKTTLPRSKWSGGAQDKTDKRQLPRELEWLRNAIQSCRHQTNVTLVSQAHQSIACCLRAVKFCLERAQINSLRTAETTVSQHRKFIANDLPCLRRSLLCMAQHSRFERAGMI